MEIEKQVTFNCFGVYSLERKGYYAATSSVENFKVYINNNDVTDVVPKDLLQELEDEYRENCDIEIG